MKAKRIGNFHFRIQTNGREFFVSFKRGWFGDWSWVEDQNHFIAKYYGRDNHPPSFRIVQYEKPLSDYNIVLDAIQHLKKAAKDVIEVEKASKIAKSRKTLYKEP